MSTKKFEFSQHFVLCLAAPRRSGKSWFIKQYLKTFLNLYDKVIIVSPSLDVNGDYDEFEHNDKFEFISNIDERTIDKIFEDSYKAAKKTKVLNNNPTEISSRTNHYVTKYRAPNVLVILDDVVDSGIVRFGGSADKIAERGRHVNITCIISVQRITAISRSIRLNSDYFIIFKPSAVSETERFIEEYVQHSKRDAFRNGVMENVFKEKYHFIMVDVTDRMSNLKSSTADDLMKGKYDLINY